MQKLLVRRSKSNSQIVLPRSLHSLVYRELHDILGHLGAERVMQLARARVFSHRCKLILQIAFGITVDA